MTKCAFMVTGFASFHGVADNPTERLVNWLRSKLKDPDFLLEHHLEVCNTDVLKVAAKDVDEYFARLADQLERPSALRQDAGPQAEAAAATAAAACARSSPAGAAHSQSRLVLLHLGVACTAKEFRLESRAYNCANFRVPDEAGWCPQQTEIEPGRGLSALVGSRLPLAAICERLVAGGHNVVVSEDAGQFVCNWTYYRACCMADKYGFEAVFVHVPPVEVHDEAEQQAFLLDVMRAIAN